MATAPPLAQGPHKWAELLCNPYVRRGPRKRGQNQKCCIITKAIRGVANPAPNTKLGDAQQNANRFVKGDRITPSEYCDSPRTHGILSAMYTPETSARSDRIAAQRQDSPHTNRYLMPGLSFKGKIFKEQQTTFLKRFILLNPAQMSNAQQQTTFVAQEYHGKGQKSQDESAHRARAAPGAPPRGKTSVRVFAATQNFAVCAHCMHRIPRSGYITCAFSRAHTWAALLCNTSVLGSPHRRESQVATPLLSSRGPTSGRNS